MKLDLKIAIGGVLLVAAAYGTAGYEIGKSKGNKIPSTEQVQQGYIAPSKLEIECKDLDGNGESETIMRIDDKSYFLRELDGKPVLLEYRINPAEVVPIE